jgi:hypothetical protein
MLEHHGPYYKYLNNKEEYLKSNKYKKMIILIYKFILINRHLKLKVKKLSEISFIDYNIINQQLIRKMVLLTFLNIYKLTKNI